MSIVAAARPKVAFAVLFDGRTHVNSAFGAGLYPQRDRRLPIGPSDADRAFIKGSCPATAPTAEEIANETRVRTLSAFEFNVHVAERCREFEYCQGWRA